MIVSFLSKDLWYRDDADIIVTQKLIKKEKTWVIGNPFEKFKEREVTLIYADEFTKFDMEWVNFIRTNEIIISRELNARISVFDYIKMLGYKIKPTKNSISELVKENGTLDDPSFKRLFAEVREDRFKIPSAEEMQEIIEEENVWKKQYKILQNEIAVKTLLSNIGM